MNYKTAMNRIVNSDKPAKVKWDRLWLLACHQMPGSYAMEEIKRKMEEIKREMEELEEMERKHIT